MLFKSKLKEENEELKNKINEFNTNIRYIYTDMQNALNENEFLKDENLKLKEQLKEYESIDLAIEQCFNILKILKEKHPLKSFNNEYMIGDARCIVKYEECYCDNCDNCGDKHE